jgi:glycosyltransferase involved in cell wall biosynthesis
VAPITCVIPVHNGGRYLEEAIDSVVHQTCPPDEILVVDDGSTDGSAAIAAAYGDRVRLIRQMRRGPDGARNRGIVEARGELIAFLDADDRYRPEKLARQLACLDAEPAHDVCLCIAENFWEPGLEAEQARYEAAGRTHATHTFIAMLARRSVFDRVGLLADAASRGSQPSSGQVEWFLRAADRGATVRVLPEVLTDRRMHGASVTHTAGSMDAYFDLCSERILRRRAG